nr:hypothetical protein CFP56_11057 [Quercus suber]
MSLPSSSSSIGQEADDKAVEIPYTFSSPTQRPDEQIELCPPHWRLPPHRSLRSKLKVVLLKKWQAASMATAPPLDR